MEHDHLHNTNVRFPDDIMISDLFHIINLGGILLNKAEPSDEDTRPFDEFMKYAKTRIVLNEDTDEKMEVEFVTAEDVPKILLGTFIG